jgi:hypothetical protein
MKSCPSCNRTYVDDTLHFCLEDGMPLAAANQPSPPATPTPMSGSPPTPIYGAGSAVSPSWTPTPARKPTRRVWPWIVGALVVLFILGVGLVVVIIGLASLGSNENSSNRSTANRNVTSTNANLSATSDNSNDNDKSSSANVEIKDAYLAHDNGRGEPGEKVQGFSASDRTMHCVIDLEQAQAGTTIKFDWIGVDAGDWKNHLIKELEYTTKPREKKILAQLTYPQDWPEGSYKIDIYVNGKFARTIAFQVE